jgi:hypothetical protein
VPPFAVPLAPDDVPDDVSKDAPVAPVTRAARGRAVRDF